MSYIEPKCLLKAKNWIQNVWNPSGGKSGGWVLLQLIVVLGIGIYKLLFMCPKIYYTGRVGTQEKII